VNEPVVDGRRTLEPGEVSAEELLTGTFPIAKRGYACDAIDSLLERAAMTIARLRSLAPPPAAPAPPPRPAPAPGEREDLIQRTLMLAQASADETLAAARSRAAALLEDAELRAKRLIADAERIAAHEVETERARARFTLGEAVAIRDVLQADIAALERFADEFRGRLRHVFESEAAVLDQLLGEAPDGRPRPREIDLTDPPPLDAAPPSAPPPISAPPFDAERPTDQPLMAVYVPDAEPDFA
jgi:hypothetical protein